MSASDPQTDALKARKRRNVAIGIALFAFMALVYLVTIVRLQDNMAAIATGGS